MTNALREAIGNFAALPINPGIAETIVPELPAARLPAKPAAPQRPYRTLFLSDIHLGTRACQAENLLSFLREHEADTIYLVGDIIDFWALSRGVYWPAAHNTFVQKILKLARHDVRVIFIPGNHDEALREYAGSHFGNVQIEREIVHRAADGKCFLLVHGDEFDQIARCHRWIAVLGDISYNVLVRINVWLSWVRRKLRRSGYWSLAGYAKNRIKGALEFIYGFESAVARYARQQGVDGVVCGHIHSAVIKDVEGITYINCGDWVDSCTAIVEHWSGRMELLHWSGNDPAGMQATAQAPIPREHTPTL